jgi:hypothetical protein
MKKNDTEMFNIDNSIFFQTVKFIFTKYFVKIDTGRFVWGGIFNDYKWGGIFTCIVWIVTIILFILVNSKKKGKKYSSAIGKESSSNRKLTIYKNYSNAMLSIFGFGYSLLVVGPFVGYITANP